MKKPNRGYGTQFGAAAVAFALVVMTGCAATIKRGSSDVAISSVPSSAASKLVLNVGGSQPSIASSDWQAFKLEWKENFLEQAGVAGIPFEMQEGPAQPTGANGTLLVVYVNDYRFLRPVPVTRLAS